MYSLSNYGAMLKDRVRMDAYRQALEKTVRPGTIVLDIGTGAGIFAMLACKLGASRVYAIDPNDVIHLARDMAVANGVADRIEFLHTLSTAVTLPEQADIIVSDLRGVSPLFQQHIPSLIDARDRFLAPEGVLIPQHDTLWATVVEIPEVYEEHLAGWRDDSYGLTMQAARHVVLNTWRTTHVQADQLLAEPQCWATLDYRRITTPHAGADLVWTVKRPGTGHGLAVWFETLLTEEIGFSTAPGSPKMVYGHAFFPWLEPVEVAVDDVIAVTLKANLVGDDYIWRWDTNIGDPDKPGQPKATFKQSTFFGALLSPDSLRKQAVSSVPTLSTDGQMAQFCLSQIDGTRSLGEIAQRMATQFPGRFSTWHEATAWVTEVVEKYAT